MSYLEDERIPMPINEDLEDGEVAEFETRRFNTNNFSSFDTPQPFKRRHNFGAPHMQKRTLLNAGDFVSRETEIYPIRRPQPYQPKQDSGLFPRKKPLLADDVSLAEAEMLLEVWRNDRFVDFNSWCQVAKANLFVDVTPNS